MKKLFLSICLLLITSSVISAPLPEIKIKEGYYKIQVYGKPTPNFKVYISHKEMNDDTKEFAYFNTKTKQLLIEVNKEYQDRLTISCRMDSNFVGFGCYNLEMPSIHYYANYEVKIQLERVK